MTCRASMLCALLIIGTMITLSIVYIQSGKQFRSSTSSTVAEQDFKAQHFVLERHKSPLETSLVAYGPNVQLSAKGTPESINTYTGLFTDALNQVKTAENQQQILMEGQHLTRTIYTMRTRQEIGRQKMLANYMNENAEAKVLAQTAKHSMKEARLHHEIEYNKKKLAGYKKQYRLRRRLNKLQTDHEKNAERLIDPKINF